MDHRITTIGDVSIEPTKSIKEFSISILIVGPTGAGKSAFIEALAGPEQKLGLSSDKLEGFTHTINAYELKNVVYNWPSGNKWPVYLIDTPGFSNCTCSEMDIIDKVLDWMWVKDTSIDYIIFLCPITDTRVSGTDRRTVEMIQLLSKKGTPSNITMVTTMWDHLVRNPQIEQRAEARFEQLRDVVWKDAIREGGQITRFKNTHESALEVIKNSLQLHEWTPIKMDRIQASDPIAPSLYYELLERINTLRQRKRTLREDQVRLITQPDSPLESIINIDIREVKQTLARSLKQLVAFGIPPPSFDGSPANIRLYEELLDDYTVDHKIYEMLRGSCEETGEQSAQGHGVMMKQRVKEAKRDLVESSARLVKFGNAPMGIRHTVVRYRFLTPKDCARQALRRSFGIFTRFTKR